MSRKFVTILVMISIGSLLIPMQAIAADPSRQVDPLARKITGAADYLPFFGIRASITSNFEVSGLLAVDAGLEIPDDAVRRRATFRRARINDAMRVALADYAHRSHIEGEAPDAHLIKRRLQQAVDRELGRGEALVTLVSLLLFDG